MGSTIRTQYLQRDVTIASGTTQSEIVDIGGCTHLALKFPAAFTGANVTVYVHDDLDDTAGTATDISFTTATGQYVKNADWITFRFISLVSASSEAADRTITVYGK